MEIQVSTAAWTDVEAQWLIVAIPEEPELSGQFEQLDSALGGTLSRQIETEDLTGKSGQLIAVRDAQGIAATRVMVAGLGKVGELTRQKLEKSLTIAARKVATKKEMTAAIAIPEKLGDSVTVSQAVETAAIALNLAAQGQDGRKAEPGRHPLSAATIVVSADDEASAGEAAARGTILGEAMNLTRDLVNQPAQDVFPESFAAQAEQVASDLGLKCDVLGQEQLEAEKMGSLLAVARGSSREPRVVAIEYKGGGDDAPTLALCGKGVTFDSGGLSMKSSDGMLSMKCDMAGAATVLGAVSAIARLKLPVNVTGYMGLVENMVSGSSYKLGDILTARNGVTIEVQNTDAEGRLVLADVLSYAVDRGADRLIDLATLTGACVVALGEDVTGVFANDQNWCDDVLSAAQSAGEMAWQLPTFDFYGDLLKSDVADCRNIGGRWGGAITAAKFLEKFVDEKPWVHLDIAGPAFSSGNKAHREGGASGCMVRTLVQTAAASGAE